MTDKPLISCIIPVFNGERFLAESLESVMAQSYRPIEIIVVDDGSKDDTNKVLDQFSEHVTTIRQDQSGAPVARNRGLEVAGGDLIAFQDSDDLWLSDKLSQQAQQLAEHPEAAICTCLWENFWEAELAEESRRLKDSVHAKPGLASWSGMLVQRDLFDRIGRLDTEEPFGDIREFLNRAKQENIVVEHVNQVLVRRRIHTDNLCRNRHSMEADLLLRLAEGNLARRRALQSQD